MATLFHPRPNYQTTTHNPKADYSTRAKLLAIPVGRFLYSIIFLISGFTHFTSGSVSYAAQKGSPMPDILVPVSGLIAIVGSLSVMLGFHARVGALFLIIFLVPVTFLMHHFWNVADPAMAQMQMIHFFKNISMIGGATLVAFYGAGPVSLDLMRGRRNRRVHVG